MIVENTAPFLRIPILIKENVAIRCPLKFFRQRQFLSLQLKSLILYCFADIHILPPRIYAAEPNKVARFLHSTMDALVIQYYKSDIIR